MMGERESESGSREREGVQHCSSQHKVSFYFGRTDRFNKVSLLLVPNVKHVEETHPAHTSFKDAFKSYLKVLFIIHRFGKLIPTLTGWQQQSMSPLYCHTSSFLAVG